MSVGVSRQMIRTWENLTARPRSDLLVAWANALGFDIVLRPRIARVRGWRGEAANAPRPAHA